MVITKIRLRRSTEQGRLLAHVDLELDGHLNINGFRLEQGERALVLKCPDTPITNTCHACKGEVRHTAPFCEHCGQSQPKRQPLLTVNKKIRRFRSVAYSTSEDTNRQWLAGATLAFTDFAKRPAPMLEYYATTTALGEVVSVLCGAPLPVPVPVALHD